MKLTLQLDTDQGDTIDVEVLSRLFGGTPAKAVAEQAVPKAETPAPAPKAPAKPKAAPKPAPAPEPTPEPEEDLISGETVSAADLREKVIQRATELVTTSPSERVKVRDALTALDAKRVSDLRDDQLEAFLAAVA